MEWHKRWAITINVWTTSSSYRLTIRRPDALGEEPGEIEDDDFEKAFARARTLIDKLEAEAQGGC
jgi:hypothetical protein